MSRPITTLVATLALLIPGFCLLDLGPKSTAAPNPVSPLAATSTVTNSNDSGAGSLRQAIASATAGDTITFSPTLTGAINLTSGQLSLTKSVTINGPGAGLLSIARSSADATLPFRIISISANQTVSISGLTISNGNTTSSDGGGGILTAGFLTINDCLISGNDTDFSGGGIAIKGTGKLRISRSTISANRALLGYGGAIVNDSNLADSMIVESCTLSGNLSYLRGGAINTTGAGAIVKSSTISGNQSHCRGGGISVTGGSIEITNSTITENRTTTVPQTVCGGGGISSDDPAPNLIRLGSTIVAGNILQVGRGPDILTTTEFDRPASPITSLDYNLIGNTSDAQFTGLISHDIRDQSANLAPLAGNGGPTGTYAPLNGSVAIDHGNNTNAPSTDQRGAPRVSDGDGLAGAVADIGAVEIQRFVVTNTNNSGAGSLREALLSNAAFGAGLIRFNIPSPGPSCIANGPCTISPTSPLPSSSKAVDIDGYSQPGSLPNSSSGPNNNAVIRIHLSGANMTAADGLVILGSNSRVRGLALTKFASALRLTNTTDCRITGNFIGLDPLGLQSSNDFGIMVSGSGNNQIGDISQVSNANIISGNSKAIEINQGSNRNKISGNYIGVDRSGLGAFPNLRWGVRVENSNQNTISRNHIAFNSESGVSVSSGTANQISRNQIHDNGLLGIDLGEDGVTLNDVGDNDSGANNLQNFPEITYAAYDGINTIVRGTLNHALPPTTNVSLEFFASSTCDSSGHGEGEAVIGSEILFTDANGNVSFDLSFPSASTGEKFITATATFSSNTSEFSLCQPVVTLDSIFQFSAPTYGVNEDATSAEISVTRTGGAAGEVAVVFQAISGSAQGGSSCGAPGVDFVNTSGSFIWPHGDSSPKTFTIPICNDHDIESAVETLEVVLLFPSSGTTIGPQGTAVLLIHDNDTPGQVRFSAPTYMTDEGNSTVTFTVTRTGVDGPAASVDYSTISGSATGSATCGEAADYINGSGTLAWAAGEMGSKTGTISICNDPIQEPNEAFTLALTNPNGVTIGTQTSVGVVINDNDDPGQVQFSVSNYGLGEANTTVSFTVTRTALDGPAASIDYATAGGTATGGAACSNGADFINTTGTLSWAAGDISSRTVNLTFCNDVLAEGEETIHLNLTHPTGGVIPPANPALSITISDDDLFRQVTNINDNGAGSLRQALSDVSSVSTTGTGSINFAPGLAGTITLLTALPDINRNVRIEGPGAKLLSVKRSNAPGTPQFRIFTISADSDVYLSGLTLANGRSDGSGGAISNAGTLNVENCSIESSAALFGGGVNNERNMTLTNSTIVGNTSLFTGPAFGGGGIQNFGQLLIVGCTISGNSAAPGRGYGGGISNGPHAQLTIAYSTVTANTAFGSSTPDYPDAGGGIFQFPFPDHSPIIKASIIAGNIAPTGPDLAGPFTSGDYNLIGSTQGANITGDTAHNLTNLDAQLGPLADNGGPTRTHALLTGSPAIDNGDNREPPATDQRGLPRVSDGDNDGSALPDIGAFELQSNCSIAFVTTSLPSAVEGAIYGQQLEATGGTTPYSFSLTSGALPTGLSLSVDGVIFGTVVAAGSFNFEVTVSDANGCFRRRTYTLVIDAAPACAIDVTSQLSIVRGGFRQNFATRRFIQTVTIKNMGTAAVAGPLSLMLDSLPGYVALYNRAGVTTCFPPLGNPYVNVPVGDDAVMTSGETVTLVLEFTNSNTQQSIGYVPHILAGPLR